MQAGMPIRPFAAVVSIHIRYKFAHTCWIRETTYGACLVHLLDMLENACKPVPIMWMRFVLVTRIDVQSRRGAAIEKKGRKSIAAKKH